MASDSGAVHLFIDRAKLIELKERRLPIERQILLDEELDEFMAHDGAKIAPFEPEQDDVRSAESRVGKECVSTCRSRWSAAHSQQKYEDQVQCNTQSQSDQLNWTSSRSRTTNTTHLK